VWFYVAVRLMGQTIKTGETGDMAVKNHMVLLGEA